jgi:Tfp pilus assembly protein FimT
MTCPPRVPISPTTPRSCVRGQSPRGFSLVDLALAVLILGIVAAVATPRFTDTLQYYQAEGAARRIEADINYIRGQARFANQTCTLTFAANAPSYTTTGVAHTNNSGRNYDVDLTSLGYTVTVQANLDNGRSVTFSPNGIPLTGSPLVGLTSGVITITAGTQSRTVTIDPVTGKARRP